MQIAIGKRGNRKMKNDNINLFLFNFAAFSKKSKIIFEEFGVTIVIAFV